MNKTRRIDVKVTEEQFSALTKKAEENSMNLSEYMIFCAMNARISVAIGKMTVFDSLSYEMNFAKKMKERGEITDAEFSRLKAAMIEKFSKTDGQ